MTRMSPAEYGEYLASQAPPITDEQAAAAARIIVAAESIQTRSETPLSERAHSVYRHVGADGEVLYIGCTVDVVDRSKAHKRQSPWFTSTTTVEVVADGLPRRDALALEQRLIAEQRPQHNRVGTPAWREEARLREVVRRPTRPSP